MTRRTRILLILLVLLLLGALLGFGSGAIKWEKVEVDLGPTDEAARNPYFVAQKLLERDGAAVHKERSYQILDQDLLPETTSTIILMRAFGALGKRRTARLLDWVNRGGQLVFSIENYLSVAAAFRTDTLLDALEIQVEVIDVGEEFKKIDLVAILAEARNKKRDWDLWCDAGALTSINLSGEDSPIMLDLSSRYVLNYSSDEREDISATVEDLGSDYGFSLIQLDHGEGSITILTNSAIWKNGGIGCDDHAYFLQFLVGGRDHYYLLSNYESPSLFTMLWDYAMEMVLALVITLVLWLWYRASRFGPISHLSTQSGSSFVDHLRAAGRFDWKHFGGRNLVSGLQRTILSNLGLRADRPHESDQALLAIAQATGLRRARILSALTRSDYSSKDEFTELIKTLRLIKDST